MKKIIIISFLLFQSYQCLISDPYRRDGMTGPRYLWNLSLNHSNLYDAQLNLELNLLEGRGFYKKIFSKGIDLTYGLRYVDDRIQHKFKILFLEQQGICPFTILSNNKIEDTIRKEYIFGQFGIKLFEWNKLDYISSDISFLRVNTDLIFEPRKYTEHHLYGLPLEPGDFNIYLITNGFFGLANLKFENNILDLSKSELKNEIFGVEAGYGIELGFELIRRFETSHLDKLNKEFKIYHKTANSLILFFESRYIIKKELKIINYGLKLDLGFVSDYFPILISYKKGDIFYHDFKNSFYCITLGTEGSIKYFLELLGI